MVGQTHDSKVRLGPCSFFAHGNNEVKGDINAYYRGPSLPP